MFKEAHNNNRPHYLIKFIHALQEFKAPHGTEQLMPIKAVESQGRPQVCPAKFHIYTYFIHATGLPGLCHTTGPRGSIPPDTLSSAMMPCAGAVTNQHQQLKNTYKYM